MNRPYTPVADSYMRARLGLPPDFDLDSVPIGHLEFVAAELRRKTDAKAEVERKEAEAEQKRLAALRPPEITPRFITSAGYLKGDRHVGGIASTGAINSHDYILSPGGADIILPIPLLISHDSRRCIGSVEAARIDDDGKTHIWANIDRRCDAQTWRRIQSGELGCFSGAADEKTLPAPVKIKGIDHYFSWRLKEVSICENGANHQCVVTEVWPPISEAQPSEIVGHVEQTVEPAAIGQADVVQSINEVAEILRLPVKPIYDKDGKMIGAQRVDKAFEQLEERLAAVESVAVMRYVGVWDAHRQYNPGECVSDHGSVHHCNKSTRARPGSGVDWTLACKRGSDGKDAR